MGFSGQYTRPQHRNSLIRTLLGVLLLIGAPIAGSADSEGLRRLQERIQVLMDAQRWHEVQKALRTASWDPAKQIGLVMSLCQAHVETKTPLVISEYGRTVPASLSVFANAYALLLRGEYRSSREVLEILAAGDADSQQFGIIGLLAYSAHTGNAELLARTLPAARPKAPNGAKSTMGLSLLTYDAGLLYMQSRIADLDAFLHRVAPGYGPHQVAPLDWTLHRAFVHGVYDRFPLAYAVLEQYYATFGHADDALLLHADLLLMDKGVDQEVAFLSKFSKRYPTRWRLGFALALARLRAGEVSKGMAGINRTVADRMTDRVGLIDILGRAEEAQMQEDQVKQLIAHIGNADENLRYNIAMFRAMEAFFGGPGKGITFVERARRMAPAALEVMYLESDFRQSIGDYGNVASVLRRILADYPNDVIARARLVDVLLSAGQRDEARELAQGTLALKRYIDLSVRRRLENAIK